MKKNRVLNIISIVILVLQLAAEGLAAYVVIRLNMLPDKYLIAMFAILLLLASLTAGLLFLKGKKDVSLVRRIIGWIVSILIIVVCLIGASMVSRAYDALHAVTNVEPETDENSLYVFVRTEDPAQNLVDTKGYTYGVIADFDVDVTQQAVSVICEVIGEQMVPSTYPGIIELTEAILDKKVDAILINGGIIDLLSEEEEYENIYEDIRILHSFPLSELEVTEPTTEPPTEPSTEPPREITTTPFVVYLSGSDTRSKKLKKKGRNDVNILAVVNPTTKQILLVNTPRDYYVSNIAGGNKKDKLTNCSIYGLENSQKILGKLYDVKINYYARVNFTGFETFVDAIGGITVYSSYEFKTRAGYKIHKGNNELNGENALGFARERYTVKGGDNGRGKNQMKVIAAIVNKVTSGTTIITNYAEILASMEGMFKTDIPMDDISALVKMQLDDMASWNVLSFAATGTGGSAWTYSSPGRNAYVMYPNKKSVNHAKKLIDRVIAGEILTSEDMKVPQ